MAIQRSITLPAYTPSAWELRLPSYPVITNTWRGSDFPELLGSLPNGAEWSLTFENVSGDEALALLLPWRATAGGQWALSLLPAALAGGVNSASMRKRLTGTTWSIAREPRKEPVKNERFTVIIDLVHELTFNSLYGPLSDFLSLPTDDVLPLNVVSSLAIAALPTQYYRQVKTITGQPILSLGVADGLAAPGTNAVKAPRRTNAQSVLGINVADSLAGVALPTSLYKKIEQFNAQALLSVNAADGLDAIALPASFAKKILQVNAQASIGLNASEALGVAGSNASLFRDIPETTAEKLLLAGITLDSISLAVADRLQIAAINPTRIKRIDYLLSLDASDDLSVAAQPTELFPASRIKAAQVALSLNVSTGPSIAALPTSFSKLPIQQFSAQSSLGLAMEAGLNPLALPTSFSKQPVQQFSAQSAIGLAAESGLAVAASNPTR